MSQPLTPDHDRDPVHAWLLDAACRGMDTAVFFPQSGDNASVQRAKATCARCPVTAQCLQAAMDRNEEAGIWGGLARNERKAVRSRRNREARLMADAG